MIGLGGRARAHDDLEPFLRDVEQLRPHYENPRNGDIDAIAESILKNGLYRPVYAQRSTGMILAGNHTYAAAMSLGATQLPVVWLDVDDSQAKRILLADNKIADLGGYDQALLLNLLQQVSEEADALLGTGYTERDMEQIAALLDHMADEQLDAAEALFAPAFSIIIECETEHEQRDLLTRFATEGITARAIIT